ncbi:MAG: tetratricopeptide repeat protein [Flavobacteriales bacterium]
MMYNLSNGWIGRPEWVNDYSKIKAEWFYEDSIIAEVENIAVFGNVASVYGNVSAYISGIKVQRGGFHSIVGKQMGKLVFKRHSWMNWNMNRSSNSFVWPSTEVKGAQSMYNSMRYAMANLRNNDALAYSDSLVKLDPNLAVAHLGEMHYLYLNGKKEELTSLMNEIKPKLDGASLAETYTIATMMPSSSKQERLKKYETALLYAANDPLLRAWYAYYLEDPKTKVENIKIGLKRFPESSILNNMMAYCMMDQDKFEEAKNYLNVYLTVHPDEPNAYDSMGDLLLQMGDTVNAKEMFFKAYEISRTLASGPEDFFNTSNYKAEALN